VVSAAETLRVAIDVDLLVLCVVIDPTTADAVKSDVRIDQPGRRQRQDVSMKFAAIVTTDQLPCPESPVVAHIDENILEDSDIDVDGSRALEKAWRDGHESTQRAPCGGAEVESP